MTPLVVDPSAYLKPHHSVGRFYGDGRPCSMTEACQIGRSAT